MVKWSKSKLSYADMAFLAYTGTVLQCRLSMVSSRALEKDQEHSDTNGFDTLELSFATVCF